MSDKTDRRAILKAAVAIPLAFSSAPAEALKLFSAPTKKRGRLLVKLDHASLSETGSVVSFKSDSAISSTGKTLEQISGHAIKMPNGDIVAYSGLCVDSDCRFALEHKHQETSYQSDNLFEKSNKSDKSDKSDKIDGNKGIDDKSQNTIEKPLAIVCHEHNSSTQISTEGNLKESERANRVDSPHQFRVKRCHSKVCIIDDRA